MSKTLHRKIVRDPIYDYIRIFPEEFSLIKTPLFQRLLRIKQTYAAFISYPSSVHTRFTHCLGAMHLAGEIVENAIRQSTLLYPDLKDFPLQMKYTKLARFWGLLHDICQGPYCHAFDDYYISPLFDLKHDEGLGLKLCDCEENGLHDALKNFSKINKIPLDIIKQIFEKETNLDPKSYEYMILEEVVKGPFGADKLDYNLRDSYFCGTTEYGGIDWRRIILTSWIIEDEEGYKHLYIEKRSRYALTSYFISRVHMYSAVYFHHKCRIVEKMLEKMFSKLIETGKNDELIGKDFNLYHMLDDESLRCKILQFAKTNEPKFIEIKEILNKIKNSIIEDEMVVEIEASPKDQRPFFTLLRMERLLLQSYEEFMKIQLKEALMDVKNTLQSRGYNTNQFEKRILEGELFNNLFIDSSAIVIRNNPHSGQLRSEIYTLDTKTGKKEKFIASDVLFGELPYRIDKARLYLPSEILQMIEDDGIKNNFIENLKNRFDVMLQKDLKTGSS